jgi:hypothetical protein
MKMIIPDEAKLKDALHLLGRRIIPCYLYSVNPAEMRKWQFNACMQTAMVVAWFMKMQQEHNYELQGKIQMFEGHFKSPAHLKIGSYNHAWVYIEGPGMFIDVARVTNPCVVEFNTRNDPEKYFPDTMFSKKEHDWLKMGTTPEYYTGKMGLEFVSEIMNLLAIYTSPGVLHGAGWKT